jgi:hypothetical protein
MKILKRILVIIAILILIPLIVAIFVKKDYAVEKEIVINKSKQQVFGYVKFLKNQNNYSKWAKMDAEMEKTYRGIDGTTGFVSAWNSKNPDVGKGEQEIKKIDEGNRIDYEIRFIEPFESTSPAYMVVDSISENKSKVKWGFSGHMAYPMNLMMLFVDFDKMIGEDFKTGLLNLKKILEETEQI